MSSPIKIPDFRLLGLLSAEQARRFEAVPVEEAGNMIRLCIEAGKEPHKGALEMILGQQVCFEAVDSKQWEQLLHQCYPLQDRRGPSQLQVEESDTIRMVNLMIEEAVQMGASDLHFERYQHEARLRFRWEGQLIEKYAIPLDQYNGLISRIKILSELDISERRLPQDGRMQVEKVEGNIDIRVSTLPSRHGEKVVLRLLDRKPAQLDLFHLKLPVAELQRYQEAISKPTGMILITGPTGSGKTTTLYASLSHLNQPSRNILTVEDPVEYHLPGINQVQVKPGIGLTFEAALRSFLRQDPDIIMVGEIRDLATAQIALRASLTGHLVFSTLHTNGAWEAVTRLRDMGIQPFLMASALRLLVAQRLVRLLCLHCRLPADEPLKFHEEDEQMLLAHYRPVGCPQCHFTGYKGRQAIYEVIPIDARFSAFIKNPPKDIESHLKQVGISSLKHNLLQLLKSGRVSQEALLTID